MAKSSSPDRSALERILEWARAEPGVTVASDGTITVAGDRPIDLTVTADEERVQLTHHHVEASEDPARFDAVRRNLPRRGSNVTGTVAAAADSLEVTLTATLYSDGMTRQGFVTAFNELVAAADHAIGDPGPAPRKAAAKPVAAEADTAETAPAAAAPATGPDEGAPTMVLSSVWVPTHRVPEGGLRAWPKPDPALEPIATLQARVELSIAEQRADWARVVGSNGWTGWVDMRRLQPLAAGRARPGAAAPSAGTGSGSFPLGAIGAVALAVAAFLPWFSIDGFDANAMDVSLKFLWDLQGEGDPMLGIALLVLGGLGLLASFLPGVPDALRRVAALGGVAVAALFFLQVHRGLEGTFSDTIGAIGVGVYVALAGAVVLLVAPKKG
jgi:hypothetical protein